jgi:hypothetical protein
MSQERLNQPPAAIPTGKSVDPRSSLPQGAVKPGPAPAGPQGPQDWDDLIVHTGEARGLADTAYHSLEPDAPTVGAAIRGQEPDPDGSINTSLPSSSNAPD